MSYDPIETDYALAGAIQRLFPFREKDGPLHDLEFSLDEWCAAYEDAAADFTNWLTRAAEMLKRHAGRGDLDS